MTQYPALHMIHRRREGLGRRPADLRRGQPGDRRADRRAAAGRADDLDRALEVAARGFRIWRKSTPQQRAAVLQGAARLMLERADDMARIATMEQGKPFAEAKIELMMNVGLFNFYAGECFRTYGRELVRPEGLRSTVRYEPVGPVAAFAPWNFPLGNPGRKLGAPIAAGCSVIMKAAEGNPGLGARRAAVPARCGA
jgi:succinate-semialdehyde dehydrogenase/glutarate-semialdehyde dehydrogenase